MKRVSVALILSVAAAFGSAQPGTPSKPRFERSPSLEFGDRWMRAGWSRKDPFEDDRKRFEAAPPSRQKLEEETERWLAKPPGNPQEAYRFGSVARLLAIASSRGDTKINPLRVRETVTAAARAMARHPADSSAEFARMRFLLEVRNWPLPNLIALARRLAERFPDRPGLRGRLATVLQSTRRSEDLLEALEIIRRLAKQHPSIVDFSIELAHALNLAGFHLKDRGLLQEAVAQYERCLRLSGVSQSDVGVLRAGRNVAAKRLRDLGD